jgi:putative glutamine amidotransferase
MPEHPSHPLRTAPGSRLHAALGGEARVNSYHHQAVAQLAADLEPVGWADDGIVEAVALRTDVRVLGVQWELQVSWVEDRRFLAPFADLVAASAAAGARSAA